VDYHVFRIESAGQVHALCAAVGRSMAQVRVSI
jgi:hypothetical protein